MDIKTLLQQAYALHQQGNFEQSKELYLQILKRAPKNQDAQVLLGALHYEIGAYAEAVEYFERLRKQDPKRTDFLGNLGAALQMTGQADAAVEVYQQVAKAQPQAATAQYNLASALKDSGRLQEAIQVFERTLALAPDYAKAHNNLGVVYKQLQDSEKAHRHFAQAVALQPEYSLAWQNLGDLAREQGQLQAAVDAYQQAVPQDSHVHFKLGTLYQQLGHLEASLSHLESAVQLKPDFAEAWRSLGATQQAIGQFEASLTSFSQAIKLRPDYSEAMNNLGNSHRELGDLVAAREAYQQALQISPEDANRVRLATLLPPIYDSLAEVQSWRQHYIEEVQKLGKTPLQIADPLTEIGQTNFYLAYQGGDDRPLQEQVAALYRPLLPEGIEPVSEPVPANGKRRVGVISAFLYHHTVIHYYERHLELLAAEPDVELVLLFAPGSQQDQTSERLILLANQYQHLPRNLNQARQLIADCRLDALIYLDIGLEPFSYFLAFTRLAPVQCVLPGHPVTTGIPTVDYYVSNTWMEKPDAGTDYSEQLIQLDSLPVWYRKPKLPEQLKTLQEMGFDPGKHLYLCPMTLFKIHPEMDAALAEILERDPLAEIAFFRFRQTRLHERLEQRFQREIPAHHQRIRFLPWAEPQTYFSLLQTADVLLDSFHFGGGSTHFLCFATGTPMITWPSAYLRGRSGAGLYKRIGISETIAESPADYARIAVKIASDPVLRESIRTQTLAAHGIIFENDEGPRRFVEWLQTLNSSPAQSP